MKNKLHINVRFDLSFYRYLVHYKNQIMKCCQNVSFFSLITKAKKDKFVLRLF